VADGGRNVVEDAVTVVVRTRIGARLGALGFHLGARAPCARRLVSRHDAGLRAGHANAVQSRRAGPGRVDESALTEGGFEVVGLTVAVVVVAGRAVGWLRVDVLNARPPRPELTGLDARGAEPELSRVARHAVARVTASRRAADSGGAAAAGVATAASVATA